MAELTQCRVFLTVDIYKLDHGAQVHVSLRDGNSTLLGDLTSEYTGDTDLAVADMLSKAAQLINTYRRI